MILEIALQNLRLKNTDFVMESVGCSLSTRKQEFPSKTSDYRFLLLRNYSTIQVHWLSVRMDVDRIRPFIGRAECVDRVDPLPFRAGSESRWTRKSLPHLIF